MAGEPSNSSTSGAISVNLAHDTLIEIRGIPKFLPRNLRGRKIALATVYRWISRDGLPVIRLGGKQYTSLEALQSWAERRTRSGVAASSITSGLRQKAVERAATEARKILKTTGPTSDQR